MFFGCLSSVTMAQDTGWSPEPFKPPTTVQRLSEAPRRNGASPLAAPTATTHSNRADQGSANSNKPLVVSQAPRNQLRPQEPTTLPGSTASPQEKAGVVLRWKKSSLSKITDSSSAETHPTPAQFTAASQSTAMASQATWQDGRGTPNRLRTASYQPPNGEDAFRPLPNRGNRVPAQEPNDLRGLDRNPNQFDIQPPGNELNNRDNRAEIQPPDEPANNGLQPMDVNQQSLRLGDAPSLDEQSGQDAMDDQDTAPNPFPNGNQDDDMNDLGRQSNANSNKFQLNCEQIRERALADDITAVSLDVSPEFGVGTGSPEQSESRRQAFAEKSPVRSWRDFDGKLIIDGKLINIVRDQVVLETASGKQLKYRVDDLSDPDQAYVAEVWQFPITCSLRGLKQEQRNFVGTTANWKASGLCHKPLMFEEVQLERYGHEIGPVLQPVVSTAHFFGNIIVMPYKAGIHPPNECQYALGYYRPGNCAPWTVGPIPISLRGGLFQAAAVTGVNFALP
jgi:hypothetical protein